MLKKSGSKIIPFPFSRRSDQNGVTQKGLPARWLAGFLLLASVGAAWAISPSLEPVKKVPVIAPEGLVVEGEPQVVSQLIGSLVGPDAAPKAELRNLATQQQGRVVLEQVARSEQSVDQTKVLTLVEELESYASTNGRYPAGLSTASEEVPGLRYSPSRAGFNLEAEGISYDSRSGLEVEQLPPKSEFRVGGSLTTETVGWGPFTQESTHLVATGENEAGRLAWLETLGQAPEWSARMFFPVRPEVTGVAFREGVYKNGEMTYDAVKGTFALKLHRQEKAACLPLDATGLEAELKSRGYGVAGDAAFLRDLGLAQPESDEGLICMESTDPVSLSVETELERLRFGRLNESRQSLVAGKFKSLDSETAVGMVAQLRVVDKLGQLHELKVRGGRGLGYDWIVGQLCPLEENSVAEEQVVFRATDWTRTRSKGAVKIVAGQ